MTPSVLQQRARLLETAKLIIETRMKRIYLDDIVNQRTGY